MNNIEAYKGIKNVLDSLKQEQPESGNSEKPNGHAEWSEEDYIAIKDIDMIIRTSGRTEHNKMALLNWLKSLSPRPKQNKHLGMKDQWCCSAAWAAVRDSAAYNGEEKQFILDFLQRCEPKPHWKPAEEQMKKLNIAIACYEGDWGKDNAKPLRELFEQLKKL